MAQPLELPAAARARLLQEVRQIIAHGYGRLTLSCEVLQGREGARRIEIDAGLRWVYFAERPSTAAAFVSSTGEKAG